MALKKHLPAKKTVSTKAAARDLPARKTVTAGRKAGKPQQEF